ncbi:MAG: pantoate--beta-alanine ligase [Candidatus Gastranaerophilales bacterium]|nr:pantoate--beta-alanine ligase [Candidatus Gastranaerophilales bacterium]
MSAILINNINDIRTAVNKLKKNNYTIGLVPTMGALHKGHASLIKKAVQTCDKVIVSIFVNPIQFGENEDFDKYPRTIETDKKICEETNVDIIFAPSIEEMYGSKIKHTNLDYTFVCPPYKLIDCMCGKSRPGHFDGAATVVLKLFNIVMPDYAFFGQKDAQQLFIIKKMVNDFNLNIKIIPCPIVRDNDGLAVSSRNIYLSHEERINALSISKALKQIDSLFKQGITDTGILFDSAIAILDKNIDLEYLEFRNFETFEKVSSVKHNTLAAIAAKSGKTRLIDNIIL